MRLRLEFDWKIVPAYDVIAMLRGAELPDEWILRGNHHDAWVNGATDPVSGMVALMEEARAVAGLARDPADITVAEIADAIEGQLYPMFCLEPTDHTCFADSRCGLQGFWGDVARAIQGVFERTTVADLAERHQRTAGPTVFTSEQLLSGLS